MSAVESKKNLETRAMRYLVRREYSRQELAQKLSTNANASDSQELETVLDALEQKGFLSAQRVVEQTAHLRRARYGSHRIIHRANFASNRKRDRQHSLAKEIWQIAGYSRRICQANAFYDEPWIFSGNGTKDFNPSR